MLSRLTARLAAVRGHFGDKPLSFSEKILLAHSCNTNFPTTTLLLNPGRVAMQDASAQTALLALSSLPATKLGAPASVHCDHLIRAKSGAAEDLKTSIENNREIFDFLRSACKKYGIDFFPPGAGIIHSIVLERYAQPGLLMLGCDSHSPNAGGLGTIAVGVGGGDAVDCLTSIPTEMVMPKVINVKLSGKLAPWCTAKDVVLTLIGQLTVNGGTGSIMEYTGGNLTANEMSTICNMGAEIGATSSVFPYNAHMGDYLRATNRADIAEDCEKNLDFLTPDTGVKYDRVIEIKLDEIEPTISGPFTPDLVHTVSKMGEFVRSSEKIPEKLSAALIGSCTNSSYLDLTRAASLCDQAYNAGLKAVVPFVITPGSEMIRATMERDGLQESFERVGGKILANACGPCIGQWDRPPTSEKHEQNSILTSYNRNFKNRNDGNPNTCNFLASPEIVTALAFSGDLTFNPLTDSIGAFKFNPPNGLTLPPNGFEIEDPELQGELKPIIDELPDSTVPISVSSSSTRLQLLAPFKSSFPDSKAAELTGVKCLMRVRGKCTTDHISAAGPWLKFKGHLENISENTLITAVNDETGNVNEAKNEENNYVAIPAAAKSHKLAGKPWMLVVDQNYGEGSAREHAAMQPRFLGAQLIVARSFARIHEMNLKKQGIIPLVFSNAEDYNKIDAGDLVDTVGLKNVLNGDLDSRIRLRVHKMSGDVLEIPLDHKLSHMQIKWILAGSALNAVAK